MKTKRPNFRVKHPYQNLINSILMGLILLLSSVLSVFLIKPISNSIGFVDAYGGNGSEERPFLIYNLDDLKNVNFYSKRTMVAGYSSNRRNFKLMANVDASQLNGIVMDSFDGTFDGNSNTITSSMQLFNIIEEGSVVKNLNIDTQFQATLFDPFSSFSLAVYKNNVLHNDLINNITGHNVKIEYGFDSTAKNNAAFSARYYLGALDNDIEDTQEEIALLSEEETTKKSQLEEKIAQLEGYKNKVNSAVEHYSIDLDKLVTEEYESLMKEGYEISDEDLSSILDHEKQINSLEYSEERLSALLDAGIDPYSKEYYVGTAVDDYLEAYNEENNLEVDEIYTDINIPHLAIANYGTITDININNPSETLYNHGGIVRLNFVDSTITKCVVNNGTIYGATNSPLGGIADINMSGLTQCGVDDVDLNGGSGYNEPVNYKEYAFNTYSDTYNTSFKNGASVGGLVGVTIPVTHVDSQLLAPVTPDSGEGSSTEDSNINITYSNCYYFRRDPRSPLKGSAGSSGSPGGRGGTVGGLVGVSYFGILGYIYSSSGNNSGLKDKTREGENKKDYANLECLNLTFNTCYVIGSFSGGNGGAGYGGAGKVSELQLAVMVKQEQMELLAVAAVLVVMPEFL